MKLVVTTLAEVVLLLAVLQGCSQPFSPKGPYEEQLVVYSVLSNARNAQFVRVYTTYNPPGVDPYAETFDPAIRNAQVRLAVGGVAYTLRDTVVPRDQTTRYTDSVHAYVADPLPVSRGDSYTLTVSTPALGSVSAESAVPAAGTATLSGKSALESPSDNLGDVIVNVYLAPQTFGYRLQLFLDFEVFTAGAWVTHQIEVPQSLKSGEGQGSELFNYPSLKRRDTSSKSSETAAFTHQAYASLLAQLSNQYSNMRIRLKDAVLVLSQADQAFYTYYSIANGFQDEFSIRTDEPDYTNIAGGRGVFGSLTSDTSVISLVGSISSNTGQLVAPR